MVRRRDVGLILVLAVATALTVPIPSASAARDPLAEAQAKITAAQVAADKAAAEYGDAETRYYRLQDDALRTDRRITSLRAERSRLAAIVRQRLTISMLGNATCGTRSRIKRRH